MRVLVIAGGHAPSAFESADAPFHGVACLAPFHIVGWGFVRRARAGITALMLCRARQARKASTS